MVALKTPEVQTGWKATSFSLKGTDDRTHSLENLNGEKGLVVMFICNHCPFVKAILDKIIFDTAELQKYGINSVAICSNDSETYSEDSFENMKKLAEEREFPFAYLHDETQEIAKAYGAVCTPDFFGFDANLQLQYRGRFDESGMNEIQGGTRELFEAMKQVAESGAAPANQTPSIGCSIKWK